ncbi:hypothetical protein D9M70_392040 [compost metagenome]
MRMAHALGLAGGAGGVEDDRGVVGLARGDGFVIEARMRLIELAPQLLQPLVRHQRGMLVVAQAARVFIDDMVHDAAGLGQLRLDFQQLVDLLLVLDDGEVDLRIVEDVDHLIGDSVLVQRHRHAAQRLRRRHGPVQPRAVVANHRQVHAALESERGQTTCQRPHLLCRLGPAVCLPDAEILLAIGRMIRPLLGVRQQPSREGHAERFCRPLRVGSRPEP